MEDLSSHILAAWIKDTLLMRDWMAIKGEVERHKWFTSEKQGRDVGWDWAYTDWMIKHYRSYRDQENTRKTGE